MSTGNADDVIRRLGAGDRETLLEIINDAAGAYKGVIPPDRWREPYFTPAELDKALAEGVEFHGIEAGGRLAGVMGIQDRGEVALVRHAYVRTRQRGQGLGGRLLGHLLVGRQQPVLVGTWAAADWAIRFYARHGFRLVSRGETEALLRRWWDIPPRQVQTSVVLADRLWRHRSVEGLAVGEADPARAAELLHVQKAAFESEATVNGVRTIPPLAQTLEDFDASLRENTYLAARLDGALVGLVRGRMQDGTCHLGRLAVLPEYQGRGIGRRLLAAIEARFGGARRFELFTGARSEGNIRLYAGLGYRQMRNEAGEIDLVYMEKPNPALGEQHAAS